MCLGASGLAALKIGSGQALMDVRLCNQCDGIFLDGRLFPPLKDFFTGGTFVGGNCLLPATSPALHPVLKLLMEMLEDMTGRSFFSGKSVSSAMQVRVKAFTCPWLPWLVV